MKNSVLPGLLPIVFILSFTNLHAQDVEAILKSDPLKVNGQFSFDQYLNNQFIDSIKFKDQYALFLSGRFNAKIYSIDFPFQFSYTNQQEDFSHPFSYNQFGTQPFYKGVKLYLGYNSLSFSPYTLSGHQFCGAGVEVAPKHLPFKGTVLYGRLVKPVAYDSTAYTLPAYDRRFYSYEFGFNREKYSISTSGIYAWDKSASIDPFPDSLGIYPKENFALSLKGNYQITSQWSINVDFGRSIFTENANSALLQESSGILLLKQRKTTRAYNAYGGQIKYSLKKTSFGIQYKYVEPGYETLGAYYTNNDLEQISLVNTSRFLEGKLNLNVNLGLERDNLGNNNMMTNRRFAGSLSVSAVPTEKISLNGSYSSFQSFSNLRSNFDYINNNHPIELMDTLNYRQVNQSVALSGSYSGQGEEATYSTSLSLSGNTSENTQSDAGGSTVLLNSTISQSVVFTESKLSLSASLFGSIVQSASNQVTFGPVISLGKPFIKDLLRTSLQAGINQTWNDTTLVGFNANIRAMASISIDKSHLIAFSGTFYTTRDYLSNNLLENLQVRLSYSYRIQNTLIRRKKISHDKTVR